METEDVGQPNGLMSFSTALAAFSSATKSARPRSYSKPCFRSIRPKSSATSTPMSSAA